MSLRDICRSAGAVVLVLGLAGCKSATDASRSDSGVPMAPVSGLRTIKAPVYNLGAPVLPSEPDKLLISRSISSELKDPGSASFLWLPYFSPDSSHVTPYCGMVNGRNSYGAYTGFMPYFASLVFRSDGSLQAAVLHQIGDIPGPKQDAVLLMCAHYGYDLGQAR